MLKLKFSVPFTSKILNFRTVTRTSCSNEKNLYKPKESSWEHETVGKSRCLEYKKALEKCPKESFVKRCQKKFLPDNPRPKCNWSAADDYLRAYKATNIRAKNITELVEANAKLFVQEMRNELVKIRSDENFSTRKMQQMVKSRILELSSLDPICAMKKNHRIVALNDQTQQEFNNLNCSSELYFQSVESELENFTKEVKCRATCALSLILSCRKCQSPEELMQCVENGSKKAAKILDDVNIDFEARLKATRIVKERVHQEDRKSFGDVTKNYERNMATLMSGVIDCIRERKYSK